MTDVDLLENQDRNLPKPGKIPEPLTVDDIRFIYSQIIRSLYKQVSLAKFKGQSNDAALSCIRTLISSIKSYESIMERPELVGMQTRIAELENKRGGKHD